eukprot:TRINITY_DN180_c0_g1_i2.p1 TRINITY_DN180_c0_g1~~TRINITY_DN180_c0_g1_i2.p1  ORF type:complete len:571 (+),score=114.69 TRINITY_DN180_c0_g1_i2:82-1794(+)
MRRTPMQPNADSQSNNKIATSKGKFSQPEVVTWAQHVLASSASPPPGMDPAHAWQKVPDDDETDSHVDSENFDTSGALDAQAVDDLNDALYKTSSEPADAASTVSDNATSGRHRTSDEAVKQRPTRDKKSASPAAAVSRSSQQSATSWRYHHIIAICLALLAMIAFGAHVTSLKAHTSPVGNGPARNSLNSNDELAPAEKAISPSDASELRSQSADISVSTEDDSDLPVGVDAWERRRQVYDINRDDNDADLGPDENADASDQTNQANVGRRDAPEHTGKQSKDDIKMAERERIVDEQQPARKRERHFWPDDSPTDDRSLGQRPIRHKQQAHVPDERKINELHHDKTKTDSEHEQEQAHVTVSKYHEEASERFVWPDDTPSDDQSLGRRPLRHKQHANEHIRKHNKQHHDDHRRKLKTKTEHEQFHENAFKHHQKRHRDHQRQHEEHLRQHKQNMRSHEERIKQHQKTVKDRLMQGASDAGQILGQTASSIMNGARQAADHIHDGLEELHDNVLPVLHATKKAVKKAVRETRDAFHTKNHEAHVRHAQAQAQREHNREHRRQKKKWHREL